jgi:hypothetical protein
MKKLIPLTLAASALLLTACGHLPPSATACNGAPLTDWGRVNLSINIPKHLTFGEGKDYIFTATRVANGQIQLSIKTEEKLLAGDMPPGLPPGTRVETTHNLTMVVRPGQTVTCYVGHKLVRFTPQLKT